MDARPIAPAKALLVMAVLSAFVTLSVCMMMALFIDAAELSRSTDSLMESFSSLASTSAVDLKSEIEFRRIGSIKGHAVFTGCVGPDRVIVILSAAGSVSSTAVPGGCLPVDPEVTR